MLAAYGALMSVAAPAPADVTASSCIHGNATYAVGQQYKPDACTTCVCGPGDGDHDGRPRCVVEDCTAAAVGRLNCRRPTRNDDECCARCEEPGCLHRGRFYAAGEVSALSSL